MIERDHARALQAELEATDSALVRFLKRPDCSTARTRLDGLEKRLRTSRLAILSACAYVALAALGYMREEREIDVSLEARRTEYQAAEMASKGSEEAEATAFDRYSSAQVQQVAAEANVPVAAAEMEQSKAQSEQARQARADATRQWEDQLAALQSKRKAADDTGQQLAAKLATAERAVAEATAKIEDFKRQDENSRYETDRRRSPVAPDLTKALDDTRGRLEQARADLDREKSRRDALALAPSPGSKPRADDTSASLDAARATQLEELRLMANARREGALAQAKWSHAQRASERDRTRMADARKALAEVSDRRARPSAIRLPVMSISVGPPLFFTVAPILLLLVYLDGVTLVGTLGGAAAWLRRRAREQQVGPGELSIFVPALAESFTARAFAIVPLVALMAVFFLLIRASQQPRMATGALVVTVTAGAYQVWSARARRRLSRISGDVT